MISRVNYLRDSSFLDKLTNEKIKTVYTKIIILNSEELPIEQIQGKVTGGSISIQGSSSVRRTGSITFLADENESEITNINNILSINKKINIFIGIENNVDIINYDKIIWFPLGIFVIVQPNISHNVSGITISLSFKDKMCLLNGECGGILPTSITFHEYNQVIGYQEVSTLPYSGMNDYTVYGVKNSNNTDYYMWDKNEGWIASNKESIGAVMTKENTVYEIIRTLVINYGGENPARVIINDVPLEIKSSVRYIGSNTLYYNTRTGLYTLNQKNILEAKEVKEFNYNENVGYIYTDFTYPGSLISNIGENITSVLDKIKTALGNFEYFYDVDGNFIFQEVKNYLNNSYDMIDLVNENAFIINETNYQVGFNNVSKSAYSFEQGNALISSFANTPSYTNIKNDYHIWGKNDDGLVIHYHLAIKEKPNIDTKYDVVFLRDAEDKYNGKIRLASSSDKNNKDRYSSYKPEDWRVELYLSGLTKQQQGFRPDIYEQEILDMLDIIYDFSKDNGPNKQRGGYKEDIVKNPNNLNYYIDFLEPVDNIHSCSIDAVGPRIYSYQKDNIKRLYDPSIPNNILINIAAPFDTKHELIMRCEEEGQPHSNVSKDIYNNLAIGEVGYSANGVLRDLLYQYTSYNESISIQSIPMYYLDVNMRISVYDKKSDIYGDYIIKSISLPLDGKSSMSISASRALERI